MRFFLILFLLLSLASIVTAQRVCTSDEYARTNPAVNTSSNNTITTRLRDTTANEIITIPVVIHVLFNGTHQNISDAQILSQIEVLNKDFRMGNADAAAVPAAFKQRAADTRIMFCLAKVDPKGRSTKGIIRKQTNKEYFMGDDAIKFSAAGGSDAWDSKRYLNIWVCNMFGRTLGYATMPGTPADKDGVVINWDVFGNTGAVRAPFNKGRTTTHEVGHWLGLKHIWGDQYCGTDDIDDTPPQKSYNYYCPTFPKLSVCSAESTGDMFMNFMDLTDDACMNMFTQGQKMKVRSQFSINGFRNTFLYSFQCDSSLATGGPLPEEEEETITDIKPQPSIHLYPNPITSKLNIVPQNDYVLEGKSCTIYSIQGKPVFQKILFSQKSQIDLSFLSPGIYFVRVGEADTNKMFKIVKN